MVVPGEISFVTEVHSQAVISIDVRADMMCTQLPTNIAEFVIKIECSIHIEKLLEYFSLPIFVVHFDIFIWV